MKQFVILRTDYPMEVHSVSCHCRSMRQHSADWKVSGETIEAVIKEETAILNSEFDHEYKSSELFRVMPCSKKS